MSYILDALKKSDQQRKRGAVPTLPPALPAAAAISKRSTFLFYGLFGTILIAIGITIGGLRPWQSPVTAPLTANPLESSQRRPQSLPIVAAMVEPERPRSEPTSAAPVAPPPSSASVPRTKVPASVPEPRRKMPESERVAMRGATPAPVAGKFVAAAIVKPDGHSGEIVPDGTAEQKLMASSDLPLSIQQELPHMSVGVHAYSTKPRDRLVSINNRLLREGNYLVPELKLEKITPDGMIFTYRGYRFSRTP